MAVLVVCIGNQIIRIYSKITPFGKYLLFFIVENNQYPKIILCMIGILIPYYFPSHGNFVAIKSYSTKLHGDFMA